MKIFSPSSPGALWGRDSLQNHRHRPIVDKRDLYFRGKSFSLGFWSLFDPEMFVEKFQAFPRPVGRALLK